MMGSKQSKNNKLKIVDRLPKGKEFSHVTAVGETAFSKDVDFDITQAEIDIRVFSRDGKALANREKSSKHSQCFREQ